MNNRVKEITETMHKQDSKCSLWTMLPNKRAVSWVTGDCRVRLLSDDIADFYFWHNNAIQKLSNLFAVTHTWPKFTKQWKNSSTSELYYVI